MTGYATSGSTSSAACSPGETLGIHRGAIDTDTITTQPPPEVMKHVSQALRTMGVEVQMESDYKYICIRAKRGDESESGSGGETTPTRLTFSQNEDVPQARYGDPSEDPGGEVRFTVELTRLDRLNDTYSLDIRRLKGNLRSYKYLYDTLRLRADLKR